MLLTAHSFDFRGIIRPFAGKPKMREEELSPRLGVSWSNEGFGKGVGSELNPAMAALVIASQDCNAAETEYQNAAHRLSGNNLQLWIYGTVVISLREWQNVMLAGHHDQSKCQGSLPPMMMLMTNHISTV